MFFLRSISIFLIRRLLYVCLCIPAHNVFATTPAAQLKLPTGVSLGPEAEGISEYRFSNGFKLLLLPDNSKSIVTVNMTYLVGSRHENYGEVGMAHLLEHLMFKGTPRYRDIPDELNKRGMNFNASASIDTTNYYASFQASDDHLQWLLTMEADRMLHSYIAQKDLNSEMTVVRNEFEASENSPDSVMLKRMRSIAFSSHNYRNPPIGIASDIEHVKIENLQTFYRTYYQPDNAILVITGKFDPAKVIVLVNQIFGKLKKPKRILPAQWTMEPVQDGERQFVIRRRGDIQLVYLGYKIPAARHADASAMYIASQILAYAPNRLRKLLVDSGKVSDVFHFQLSGYAPGLQIIAAVVKKDEPLEPVQALLTESVESFFKTMPTESEMTQARLDSANVYDSIMSDPENLGINLPQVLAQGDWRWLFAGRDRAQKITAAQVSEIAAKYFRRDNRTTGLFMHEEKTQRTEIPAAPDIDSFLPSYRPRAAMASGEEFDSSPKNLDLRTHKINIGGLKLALLPKKTRGETVSVAINLNWGDADNLFGKKMVSYMTSSMMGRATERKTKEELEETSARLKMNGNIYHFQTTREHLEAALQLVSEALQQPRFEATQLEQLRKQMLVSLESDQSDPSMLATMALQQHFNRYPAGDWRSALSLKQQMKQVQSVTLDDIKTFHRQFYGASSGEIAIVGDFDPDTATRVIRETLSNWKSASRFYPILREYADITAQKINIHTPDKKNGVYMALLGLDMRDSDKDFPALLVANYLIGNPNLKSRLADRVRQRDGLSYHISSSLEVDAISNAAAFAINATAAPQELDKVAQAVREELHTVMRDGFTDEELESAKSGIRQQHQQSRAQDSAISSGWTYLLGLNRNYAWAAQLDESIAALTLEQVNQAARNYLVPESLTEVIARDESKSKTP